MRCVHGHGPWCARTLGFAIGAVGALVSLSPGLLFQVFHQYSFMHRSRSPFVRASTLAHSQRWLRNFGSWPLRLAESPSLGFAACGRPSDSVHPKRRRAGYIENKKSRVSRRVNTWSLGNLLCNGFKNLPCPACLSPGHKRHGYIN